MRTVSSQDLQPGARNMKLKVSSSWSRQRFSMQYAGWILVAVGAMIVIVGLVWALAPSLPWLGKLPGDIVIERENFRIYFPLATSLILSALLSCILWLVRHLSR